jgi:hypothetical protein
MENIAAPTVPASQPMIIRMLAHIISFLFHPLFITTYVTAWLLYIHPYAFIDATESSKPLRLISIFINTAFLPAFSVFLMWRLKLVESVTLQTQKDRIIPFVACQLFFGWAWWVAHNQEESPSSFRSFLLGTFFAVCAGWLLNIKMKVSMHALAVGGMLIFFLLQAFQLPDATGLYLTIAILTTGLVCTARFIISDHRPVEIYIGLFAGAACQLIGYWL